MSLILNHILLHPELWSSHVYTANPSGTSESLTAFDVFAPQPQVAIAGEPPSFLQSDSNLLGMANTHRSIWIRRLERRARGDNTGSSAHPTITPHSPLSPQQELPLIHERFTPRRSTLSCPSEFALLQSPRHLPLSPSQQQNLNDLLRDDEEPIHDHASMAQPFRRVAFDLDEKMASADSSLLRTPPPPKQGYIDLPPDEHTFASEGPEYAPTLGLLLDNNEDEERVHIINGYVPLNKEEAWHSQPPKDDTNPTATATSHTSNTDESDSTLIDLLLCLHHCSTATSTIQRVRHQILL